MANYTAADIKALRESTGAGMLAVKKALDEADGDKARATEILRVKGLQGVTKREGRATSEGLVAASVVDGAGVLIELDCETDFVAKSEKFIDLGNDVLEAVVAAGAADTEAALAAPVAGGTVKSHIDEQAAALGEKVELRRVARIAGDQVVAYLHRTNPDLPPQVGVVLAVSGDNSEVAHDVALHIAAMAPEYVTADRVPEEVVANERRIAEEETRAEGKPEKIIPKIVEGRVHGFLKQIVLVDQAYAKENKKSVGQVLKEAGLTAVDFARFRVGA